MLTSNKFRMVYKVDGNPQLDSSDWSMYSNILKLKSAPWTLAEFFTIGLCNHLMRIISTYVSNTKKSDVS